MRLKLVVGLGMAAPLFLAGCDRGNVVPLDVPGPLGERATHYVRNPIPPRLQWLTNFGYCGEVSLISAGLNYGQYVSQYDARAIASNSTPQYLWSSQLLLGVNANSAASQMGLSAISWNPRLETSTDSFLAWVKHNVVLRRPVAIGIYTNEYRFYGITDPHAGAAIYDHIVPVTGIASAHPIHEPGYFGDDVITFSDNGVWGPPTPYHFSYTFDSFQRNRVQANAPNGPIYSIDDTGWNLGIAITGVRDPQHETLPVRLLTNVNYERPPIANGSNARPAPMPLLLTVTVSNLRTGTSYKLYRYDSFSKLPDGHFNANAQNASERLSIRILSGSRYIRTERIMSDQMAIYRAVPAVAP